MCVVLSGCTANPWFGVRGDGPAGTGDGETGASTGSTSEAPGPTTSEPTGGMTMAIGGTTTEIGGSTESGGSDSGGSSTTLVSGESTVAPATDTQDEDTNNEESDTGDTNCGDGVKDGGEDCDNGTNLPTSECPLCKFAECGDGFVQAGQEACDLGPNNNDTGIECTKSCALPRCGDGFVQGVEMCDDGADNGTPMNCSVDCVKEISGPWQIRVSASTTSGKIIKNAKSGIAGADEICNVDFNGDGKWLAMIADGTNRVASASPFMGTGQVGWVLEPYAAYVNANGQPIGVTGPEALLGRPAEMMTALVNPIGVAAAQVWTGLDDEWTTAADCGDWKSVDANTKGVVGQATDATNGYLHFGESVTCGAQQRLYCVQVQLP